MIRSLDELTPATAASADAWLDASVARLPRDYRDVVRDDLLTAVCERADASMTPEQLRAVIADIPVVAPEADEGAPQDRRVGRFFGVPYDFRTPTGERLRQAMWNTADPRVLTPRSFGIGWDINLGALAVKLGIIEPDAEDVPFAEAPQDAFVVAAALPWALTGAVIAHYAVRGPGLADELPTHWDAVGAPDAWTSRRVAAGTDLAMAAGGGVLAATALSAARPGAERAGRLAFAGMLAGGAAAMTVARSAPKGGWWVGPLLLGSLFGGAAAPLFGLALAGRRGEQRRDLGANGRR